MKAVRVFTALCALILGGCGDGSVQSPGFTPVLTAISIVPTTADPIHIGETADFTAIGTFTTPPGSDTSTTQGPIDDATWTVASTAIATVDGNGTITGVAEGATTITASRDGITSPPANLTILPSELISIAITPPSASIGTGATQQFQAQGTYRDAPNGPTRTGAVTVTWSSDTPAVATISSTGLASALHSGAATITATSGSLTATATLTVNFTSALQSIEIAPATATVPLGGTTAFSAVGTFSGEDGTTTTGPVTDLVWSVEPSDGASITAQGVATGLRSGGPYIVRASSGTISDTAELTVGNAVLTGLLISEEPSASPPVAAPDKNLPLGTSQRYKVLGIYSDSTTPRNLDAGDAVTWTSSSAAVTLAPTGEPVTNVTAAQANGVATVTVTSGAFSDAVVITVADPILTGLFISEEPLATPPVAAPDKSLPLGTMQRYRALGVYSDSPTPRALAAGNSVTWSSSTAAVTLAPLNELTTTATAAQAGGSSTITASAGGFSDAVIITVSAPVLTGLVVSEEPVATPVAPAPDKSLPLGATQRYRALGVYSDSDTPRVLQASDTVTWSSSTAAVTLSPLDQPVTTATAAQQGGVATVTATVGSFSDSVVLTVVAAALDRLVEVRPPSQRVPVGQATLEEYQAFARYTDGQVQPISDDLVTWSVAPTAIATIDANGRASGVAIGDAVVTATLKSDVSQTATAALVVTDSACTTPFLQSQGAVVATDTNNLCLLCNVNNPDAVINDARTDFATINLGIAALGGEQSLTASGTTVFPGGERVGFVLGRPTGALVLAEVASQIQVSTVLGGSVRESSGPTIPLRLDLLGLEIIPQSDTFLVSFRTSQGIAYDGVRVSLGSGLASALTDVQVFQACATVFPPPAASTLVGIARVLPAERTTRVGSTVEYQAVGLYADGSEAPLSNDDVTWSSGTPSIASINAAGIADAEFAGTAQITASLKVGVPSSGSLAQRTASTSLTVVNQVCETELRADEGVTATSAVGGLCLFCNVSNLSNVIDGQDTTYANMQVPAVLLAGLLGTSTSITLSADETANPPYAVPFPIGSTPSFLVGRPSGALTEVQLGSQLTIATLRRGVVQERYGQTVGSVPLNVDLLGTELLGNSQQALVSFPLPAALPYDQIRLEFNGGLLSALTNIRVYSACGDASLPVVNP